uniref:Uncharacterized protein n=1 Tax=Strongyloides papillosus TaxID=174720 RepID=A0A0N5BXG0_STREA
MKSLYAWTLLKNILLEVMKGKYHCKFRNTFICVFVRFLVDVLYHNQIIPHVNFPQADKKGHELICLQEFKYCLDYSFIEITFLKEIIIITMIDIQTSPKFV